MPSVSHGPFSTAPLTDSGSVTDFTLPAPFAIPQFNPAMGVLTGVTLDVVCDLSLVVLADGAPFDLAGDYGDGASYCRFLLRLRAAGFGGLFWQVMAFVQDDMLDVSSSSRGIVGDVSHAHVATGVYSDSVTSQAVLTSATDLAYFAGTGTMSPMASVAMTQWIMSGDPGSISTTGRAQLALTVTYFYSEAGSVIGSPIAGLVLGTHAIGQPEAEFRLATGRAGSPTAGFALSAQAIGQPTASFSVGVQSQGQPIAAFMIGTAAIGTPVAGLSVSASKYRPDAAQLWALAVTVGGVDVSARLTGGGSIEWEEGSARIAEIKLLPGDDATDPSAWVGLPVTIGIACGPAQAGATAAPVHRFTGVVDVPQFDPLTRTTTLRCTDDLQAVVGRLSADNIDAVTPGALFSTAITGLGPEQQWLYSLAETTARTAYDYDIETRLRLATSDAAVAAIIAEENTDPYVSIDPAIYARTFHSLAEAWSYAQARLDTLPGSLTLDAYGVARYTAWAPADLPDLAFGVEDINEGTLSAEISHRQQIKNTVRISFTHRFPRCKCRALSVGYTYPYSYAEVATHGYSIPTRPMVKQALAGTGWEMPSEPNWAAVPYGAISVPFGTAGDGTIQYGVYEPIFLS